MSKHDPIAALRIKDFQLYSMGAVLAVIGSQMQSVAVGWELYERTNSALSLGWVGLLQALPVILLALPAGQLADQYDRRRIVLMTQVFTTFCSIGLALISYYHAPIFLVYPLLLLGGVAKAFMWPARSAMVTQLVPISIFSNAATWSSTFFQIGAISGPALGGLIIANYESALPVYIIDAIFGIARFIFVALITSKQTIHSKEPMTLNSLIAGFDFVWKTKIILATITLDLFAVLLGGATTLLPIFAKDILQVGPGGLGWLRAAGSIGAVIMAFALAYLPPMRKAGKSMLWSVAIFGFVTIVFGFSQSFLLSFSMLFLAGAVDMISVVVRQTLVQVLTPDEMRGRVSAVNSIFITSSNEIGGFESGVTAAIFGPVTSVVGGGIGTVLVVVATILIWPEIKKFGSLEQPKN
ncbi:MAG: MFS transporter [Blastocatellia bacterium]